MARRSWSFLPGRRQRPMTIALRRKRRLRAEATRFAGVENVYPAPFVISLPLAVVAARIGCGRRGQLIARCRARNAPHSLPARARDARRTGRTGVGVGRAARIADGAAAA